MDQTIWQYWEGPQSPVIKLCHETVARHNPTARVVSQADVVNLGGSHILEATEGMRAFRRSDIIRLWLIYTQGGIWIDSDCIATAPLNPEFTEKAESLDLVGVHNPHLKGSSWDMIGCPIGARKGSPIIKEGLDRALGLLAANGDKGTRYMDTNLRINSSLWRKYQGESRVQRFTHWRYSRVPWNKAEQVYMGRSKPGQHEISPYWQPGGCLYHLTNKITHLTGAMSKEQILSSRRFYSFLFQKALSLPPAVPKAILSVIRRLPRDQPLTGAEVGVAKGIGSRNLLQQLPQLKLYSIDAWATLRKGIGEAYTGWGSCQWEKVFNQTRRRLEWAGERSQIIRKPSQVAAKQLANHSLDFAYIDGEHTYKGCKADLMSYLPLIKPGGLLCGHDYNRPKEAKGIWGVKRAVDELSAAIGKPVELGMETSWFIRL